MATQPSSGSSVRTGQMIFIASNWDETIYSLSSLLVSLPLLKEQFRKACWKFTEKTIPYIMFTQPSVTRTEGPQRGCVLIHTHTHTDTDTHTYIYTDTHTYISLLALNASSQSDQETVTSQKNPRH